MTNYKKLFVYFSVFALVLTGLLFAYTRSQAPRVAEWRAARTATTRNEPDSAAVASRARLLSEDGETRALVARNARRVRSPAFVPGTPVDAKFKAAVERLLAEPRAAAANERLKESFPDAAPTGFWIRAAIALASAPAEGEVSPERFEAIGKVYAEVLGGEESAIAALETGLRTLPRAESLARRQAVRMLSDIGLKNRELRDEVKSVLLGEAARAGSPAERALAYGSLLRLSPSKEWTQDVGRAYERQHPGSDLSVFVSLNAAHL